jgi:prepilin signal peptidase PulO-like enzyme (type II secretory pathway)
VTDFAALPLPVRLAAIFALGLAAGSAINWGIYALAYLFPRPISPWQAPHADAPPRQWLDFVPVLGWLGLARESKVHGPAFWLRPMLIELATAIGLASLYYWEVAALGLTPPAPGIAPASIAALHHLFVAHLFLICLMLVATFIDFDEKTVPDEITIPGTLLGLLLAALWSDCHLPVVRLIAPAVGGFGYGPLRFTSLDGWPPWLDTWRGLAIALAAYLGWCVALLPATCTLRRGWSKALAFYFASILRRGAWWKWLVLATLGGALLAFTWSRGGLAWQSVLTAVIGMAGGGGLIWAVRIVGQVALRKEAMGFGDVTLMAMIGVFLGWQACLMIFFLSPFAALVVSVAQWLFTGRRDIAFGPYLCLAAVVTIVYWDELWNGFAAPIFAAGWLVPALVAVCLVLMMGLLMAWRVVEGLLFGR